MGNKQTRRGLEIYERNPFMLDMTTKTRRVINKKTNMVMVNKDTGEIQSEMAGFWEAQEVDSTKFVKLFIRGVKALQELTGAGTKVFEVLYHQVQKNIGKDSVYLAFSSVDQTITPMSQATYARGMRELVQKEFIAATENQGIYWINPSYIWNGDRLLFIREFRKKPTIKNSSLTSEQLENLGQQRLPIE